MSFIGEDKNGATYAPGWFLADDEGCIRITHEFDADGEYVVTAADGAKYVPMGSIIPSNESANLAGIAYEDVDVTNGNMPGSLVTQGAVYIDRLIMNGSAVPAEQYAGLARALSAIGISALPVPDVTRPDFDGGDEGSEGGGDNNGGEGGGGSN